jgi:3-oxoacyl-[acyl-carrier protein] reductase
MTPQTFVPGVALVTGAAGGLGTGLITELARQGWKVAAGFHRQPISAHHGGIWSVALDVSQTASVDEAFSQLMARWERIDLVVNNAGIASDSPLWQMNEEDWTKVLEVDLTGAARVCRRAAHLMATQGNGHIVNISSFSARSGPRGQTNYAAAKAGLLGLTVALAQELGPFGVQVNAILPGVLRTPMTESLDSEVLDAFVQANALGRLNEIEEVAKFVVFLAGMKNVSGQVFQLDSRPARWT